MYGIFTILNGVLGGVMMFFHITSNEKTRELIEEYPVLLEDGGGFEREHRDNLRDFVM